MRVPSVKALTEAFPRLSPDNAKLIRALGIEVDNPDRLRELIETHVPATERYVRSLYSDPYDSDIWRVTVALHAMDQIMGTHGVEGLGPTRSGDYAPAYEYLNTGDTYATTLIYDRARDALKIGSWGDIAERHPEWE
jgi:hypothetical protein